MTATIIDGKLCAEKWKEKLKNYVAEEKIAPAIAVIMVGNDPASQVYVRNKLIACERVGITCKLHTFPEDIAEKDLLRLLYDLNSDEKINGVLVQMPLPPHIDAAKVTDAIAPDKDIDGFHSYNLGRLYAGRPHLISCTPMGIVHLIKSVTDIIGKNAVVIGRSLIVGRPVAAMLVNENATVTIAHSKTVNLPAIAAKADILVSATGRAGMVTAEYVKKGAVVIDVGITRGKDGKLTGDVVFDEVKNVAGAITPVPGGVGPMTIAMLMYNAVKSCLMQNGKKMSI